MLQTRGSIKVRLCSVCMALHLNTFSNAVVAWTQVVLSQWFGFHFKVAGLKSFGDGILFRHLLNCLVPASLEMTFTGFVTTTVNTEERVANLNILFAKFEPLKRVSASDVLAIAQGSALESGETLWKIALEYHLSRLFGKPMTKADFVRFLEQLCGKIPINNLSSSWETGVPFCLLVHKVNQNLLDMSATASVRTAFITATKR